MYSPIELARRRELLRVGDTEGLRALEAVVDARIHASRRADAEQQAREAIEKLPELEATARHLESELAAERNRRESAESEVARVEFKYSRALAEIERLTAKIEELRAALKARGHEGIVD